MTGTCSEKLMKIIEDENGHTEIPGLCRLQLLHFSKGCSITSISIVQLRNKTKRKTEEENE